MHRTTTGFAVLLAALPLLAGSSPGPMPAEGRNVDPNKPVVCLLPGRVRKLGGLMTYMDRRKPEETTASECEIRGGEYTFYDRANYRTALAIWMEAAEGGDARAMVHVGEIHEKGWIDAPDFVEAARWYGLAAEQGDARGQRRLAYFYENGLGVERDVERALALWRRALDLDEDLVLASELEAVRSEAEKRIGGLLAQLEQQNLEMGRLQRTLEEQRSTLGSERQALAQANTTVEELQRALEQARADTGDPDQVDQLRQQLAAREAFVTEQQTTIALLEADLAAQHAQVAASVRQAELRGEQLARARAELEAEAAKGDALLRRLDAQKRTIADAERQLAEAQASLARNENREADLRRQLTSRADGDDDRAERLEQELIAARQQQADMAKRIASLDETLGAQRDRFEAELAAANVREDELDQALARSQAEKTRLAEALNAARATLDDLDAELTRTRDQLAVAQAGASALEERLAATGQDDDAARNRLQAELATTRKTLEALAAERDRLDALWQKGQAERNALLADLTSEQKTVTWLECELKEYQAKHARAQFQKEELERALADMQFEKQQLNAQVAKLNEDLALGESRQRDQLAHMRDRLETTKTALADTTVEVSRLLAQKEKLESQIALNRNRQQGQMLAMRGMISPPPSMEMPAGVSPGKYRALIIANYDYLFMNDLSTPKNDAAELQSLLKNRYGFDVEVRINLTRSEMFGALNRIREYGEEDFVLVYYAGHGMMDEFGDGYWLPTDHRRGQPLRDSISTGDITAHLKQSAARHVLLVADSCYSGALLRDASPVVKTNVPALMKFWLANRSRTVLTSGGLKPVLDEGPGSHSVFAGALLEVLDANRGALNGEILHSQVYDIVLQEAARLDYLDQQPQFAAIEDAGHENGQFVFVPTGT